MVTLPPTAPAMLMPMVWLPSIVIVPASVSVAGDRRSRSKMPVELSPWMVIAPPLSLVTEPVEHAGSDHLDADPVGAGGEGAVDDAVVVVVGRPRSSSPSEIAPWLSMLPVLPPCARMPTVLLTSVFEIVVPVDDRDVVVAVEDQAGAGDVRRAGGLPPLFGVMVQLVPVVMSAPLVPVPAAGQAANADPPIRASSGATATAVRRTLRMQRNSLTAADGCR